MYSVEADYVTTEKIGWKECKIYHTRYGSPMVDYTSVQYILKGRGGELLKKLLPVFINQNDVKMVPLGSIVDALENWDKKHRYIPEIIETLLRIEDNWQPSGLSRIYTVRKQ